MLDNMHPENRKLLEAMSGQPELVDAILKEHAKKRGK